MEPCHMLIALRLEEVLHSEPTRSRAGNFVCCVGRGSILGEQFHRPASSFMRQAVQGIGVEGWRLRGCVAFCSVTLNPKP